MVFDKSIRQFLEEAGSSSPTPGGGSIAALAAALGASMGSMVASLTKGPKFEAVQEQMSVVVEKMKAAIHDFEGFLKQDMDAFTEYMTALGMPKGLEDEKAARSLALQHAAVHAADVPLKLMQRSVEIILALEEVADQVNKNVISDLGIAAIMLEAAIQSAWITVEINLGGMKNEERKTYYQQAGAKLVSQSQEVKQNILHVVRAKMS